MTDGQENASQRYSRQEIHNMISHAQEHGWDVLFLGANIDVERYRKILALWLATLTSSRPTWQVPRRGTQR